jgi:hypothetical protein
MTGSARGIAARHCDRYIPALLLSVPSDRSSNCCYCQEGSRANKHPTIFKERESHR